MMPLTHLSLLLQNLMQKLGPRPLCHEPSLWLWAIHVTSRGAVHEVHKDFLALGWGRSGRKQTHILYLWHSRAATQVNVPATVQWGGK